jgi:hypothetical protein
MLCNETRGGKEMLQILQRYLLRQGYLKRTFAALSIGLLLSVIAVGIAACGSSTTGSPNPTPTTPTQAQKCGSVKTNPRGVPVNAATAKQAEDCFWQAFQQCHPASLSFTSTSVDTVAVHTFTIQSNGQQCSVNDAGQHAIVPRPLSAAKTYACTGVAMQADGLHVTGCGNEGDIIVPLK